MNKKNSPWHKILFTSDNFTLAGISGSSYKGNYVRETTYALTEFRRCEGLVRVASVG